MKDYNVLIIGCGFFSQNIYLPIVNYFFKKKQIFLFDERSILKKKTSNFFGYNYFDKFSKKELKKNNIKICFLCFERTKSFFYAKKILESKIHLFAEKPICDSSENIEILRSISKKNKVVFDGSFQRLFDKNILNLKKKINKLKSVKLDCFFESGNFRYNKKTLIRTREKISTLKKNNNANFISYLIFLNRYWHIINVVNNLTNYLNLKNNKIKFIKSDMFTYYLEILNKNIKIRFYLSSKRTKGWSEKYILKNKKQKIFNLKAPMQFSKKKLNKTAFYLQIKNFIETIKMLNINNDRVKTFGKELEFIQNLWKKYV